MTPDLSRPDTWRKSTRSNGAGSCVEINSELGSVRDSKNQAGPNLSGDVPRLVRALKAGRLQR